MEAVAKLPQINQLQALLNKQPDNILDILCNNYPVMNDLRALEHAGLCTQMIDENNPTLKSVLYRLLSGRIDQQVFDNICGSFKNMQERYIAQLNERLIVYIYTTKTFETFIRMAVPVCDKCAGIYEETVGFECIYTDDKNLDIKTIPVFDSEEMYGKLLPENQRWFSPRNIYLLELVTMEQRGQHKSKTREYVMYLPAMHIKRYD